ncbi:hypothetical protein HZH66_006228 [Vespula vulgaris]|uniref:PiggyBac transposable element-derived protein domain-containing protein n=1 Tax=Vespula vulgaris TaxID=7454 RepID=A0A834NAJ3_VESVU|nr:hypothetical protein HZH66_006228 [Vespula vulgaris]
METEVLIKKSSCPVMLNHLFDVGHVTMENFFTSVSLATKLLAKRITLFTTNRSNRRKFPKLAKSTKDKMEHFSTVLYKSNNCTLIIYKSKPTKKVTILSWKHKSIKINNDRKRITETVVYYNKTKFGVNIIDQIARKYNVKSKSYRWPVLVFFNILDLTNINAWILYKETSGQNISKQQFVLQIVEELAKDYYEFLQEEKYKEHQVSNIIFHIREKRIRYDFAKKTKQLNLV